MRFYSKQHRYYCGIDLHARTMYVCVLDQAGKVRLHRNLPCDRGRFLRAINPYRRDLVVAAECMFTWYWLADLCAEQGIPFVLGHALYMKAIHGGKTKNDRVDALKIASLLRGGNIPMAYVYPPNMRSTRDLLRRRTRLVRVRASLFGRVRNTRSQYNVPAIAAEIRCPANREPFTEGFDDPVVVRAVEADLWQAEFLDGLIRHLELFLKKKTRIFSPTVHHRLRTVPGIGDILGMTILYEIHDIRRFPRVQDFVSYARLVKCPTESAGKRTGTAGAKIGNPHLKWAFSEAAVLMLRQSDAVKRYHARLQSKHGKGKALSILAHKLGRAVYFMLKRKQAFDLEVFLKR